MARKRKHDGFVPIGDVADGLSLPGGRALTHRAATPQARHHFTKLDQVTQLVGARNADPEIGFMARFWCAPITASVASSSTVLSAVYSSKFICSFFARAASRIAFMRSISASGISDRSSIRSETSATRRQFGREKQSWEARTVMERPSLPALTHAAPLFQMAVSPSADFALLMGTSSRGSKVSLISQAQMVHKGLNPYS